MRDYDAAFTPRRPPMAPPDPYAHARELGPADLAQKPQEDSGPMGMIGGLLGGGGGKGGSGGGGMDYLSQLEGILSSAFGG